MPDITYTIGGVPFDAVPDPMRSSRELPVKHETTIGRTSIFTPGLMKDTIVLTGKFMSVSTAGSISAMQDACETNGTTVVFDDSYSQRDVLIKSFETSPIVGVTEGFSFRLVLVVTGLSA